jgi:hypothetical protein
VVILLICQSDAVGLVANSHKLLRVVLALATDRAWWVQYGNQGGHANNNFYVHIRDVRVVVGTGNAGAVAILWLVAQQASLRNIVVDLTASGAIAFDQGTTGYAQACFFRSYFSSFFHPLFPT